MTPDELIKLVVQLGKRLEEQAQQLEAQAERITTLETENAKLKQLLASEAEKKGRKRRSSPRTTA